MHILHFRHSNMVIWKISLRTWQPETDQSSEIWNCFFFPRHRNTPTIPAAEGSTIWIREEERFFSESRPPTSLFVKVLYLFIFCHSFTSAAFFKIYSTPQVAPFPFIKEGLFIFIKNRHWSIWLEKYNFKHVLNPKSSFERWQSCKHFFFNCHFEEIFRHERAKVQNSTRWRYLMWPVNCAFRPDSPSAGPKGVYYSSARERNYEAFVWSPFRIFRRSLDLAQLKNCFSPKIVCETSVDLLDIAYIPICDIWHGLHYQLLNCCWCPRDLTQGFSPAFTITKYPSWVGEVILKKKIY